MNLYIVHPQAKFFKLFM